MAASSGKRLTTRRILLATFWFAAAFGAWRLAASLDAPPFVIGNKFAVFGCVLGGVALFGAGVGAMFGRMIMGASVAIAVTLILSFYLALFFALT